MRKSACVTAHAGVSFVIHCVKEFVANIFVLGTLDSSLFWLIWFGERGGLGVWVSLRYSQRAEYISFYVGYVSRGTQLLVWERLTFGSTRGVGRRDTYALELVSVLLFEPTLFAGFVAIFLRLRLGHAGHVQWWLKRSRVFLNMATSELQYQEYLYHGRLASVDSWTILLLLYSKCINSCLCVTGLGEVIPWNQATAESPHFDGGFLRRRDISIGLRIMSIRRLRHRSLITFAFLYK